MFLLFLPHNARPMRPLPNKLQKLNFMMRSQIGCCSADLEPWTSRSREAVWGADNCSRCSRELLVKDSRDFAGEDMRSSSSERSMRVAFLNLQSIFNASSFLVSITLMTLPAPSSSFVSVSPFFAAPFARWRLGSSCGGKRAAHRAICMQV